MSRKDLNNIINKVDIMDVCILMIYKLENGSFLIVMKLY